MCREDGDLGLLRRPRARGLRISPTLEIGEQRGERAVEDLGSIAGRDDVPEQILDPAQLVVRLARDRQLHLVSVGRQRRHRRLRCEEAPSPMDASSSGQCDQGLQKS